MTESKMLGLVEHYYINLMLLTERQNQLDYNIKVTSSYSLTGGGGHGFSCSKVETEAVNHASKQASIEELQQKILIVDESMKILDKYEREVIEKIKLYKNKLGTIARSLGKKTKYVYTTRKRAIKKMCEYIGGNECIQKKT
jgi:uncharacterized protein YlzI (FlbEa/FlbD family)